MNCTDVRAALPLLIYGETTPQDAALRQHLAVCPACRREAEALQDVRRLLDQTTVPRVEVDAARIQRELAERQLRQARRWRRVAVAVSAVAALLLLAFALRLEIRLDAKQVVVRWGEPSRPEPDVRQVEKPIVVVPPAPPEKPEFQEDLRVLSDLIRAVMEDVEGRDQRLTERLDRVQRQVHSMETQSNVRWNSTKQDVAALYLLSNKGDKP